MMSTFDSHRSLSSGRRLQFVLLLLLLWDTLALVAELSFGGPLLKIADDGDVTGWVAAKGSFGGAMVVPMALYFYALVRGPLRYRNILWVGAIEQGAVALFAVFHVATDVMHVEGIILPLLISSALLVVVLVNMPRSQPVA
jgi:hypothetical protein